MSDFQIGLIVVFGPLALAALVLPLIDYADRRSRARPPRGPENVRRNRT